MEEKRLQRHPPGQPAKQSGTAKTTNRKAPLKKASPLADFSKGVTKHVTEKTHEKLHAAVSEAEQDNTGIETAHAAERVAEGIYRMGKGAVKKYQSKRKAAKKEEKENNRKLEQSQTQTDLGASRKQQNDIVSNQLNAKAEHAVFGGIIVEHSGTEKARLSAKSQSPHAPSLPGKPSAENVSTSKKAPPLQRHTSYVSANPSLSEILSTPVQKFGQAVDFSPKKPGLISRGLQTGKNVGTMGLQGLQQKAGQKLRSGLDSTDNSSVQAFSEVEQIVERPVKYLGRKGKETIKKPVNQVVNKARSAVRHRFNVMKMKFLQKHKAIAGARGVALKVKAIAQAIMKTFLVHAKPVLIGIGVCFLIYALMMAVVMPLSVAVSKAGAEYVMTTTYPVASQDVTASTSQWKDLEVALLQRVENIETEFPGFDEYRYDLDDMQHNPFELMAYLAAMHLDFTHPQVQAEIAALFAQQNPLIITEKTETRYDSNNDPYEWKILEVSLKPKPFEEIVTPRLEAADAKELYDVFMGSGGNQQAFGNPFTFNWQNNVSSYYGQRPNPTGPGYEFHTGIDIAVPEGTPIRSIQTGFVVVSGWHDAYGNYIVIRNELGISSLYAHCHTLNVQVGDPVGQGQIIATVGSTGRSTGPHLHLELKINDERVNPLFYIQAYNE